MLWLGKTAAADNDSDGGQQPCQTMTVVDKDGTQYQAADYDGEGREQGGRYSGDSRVTMMAAAAEDGGSG